MEFANSSSDRTKSPSAPVTSEEPPIGADTHTVWIGSYARQLSLAMRGLYAEGSVEDVTLDKLIVNGKQITRPSQNIHVGDYAGSCRFRGPFEQSAQVMMRSRPLDGSE